MDAQLAGGQLQLVLVHLLVALRLGALQLLAALHHGLHLRLHLADVEAGHRELLVDHAAALVLLGGGGVRNIFIPDVKYFQLPESVPAACVLKYLDVIAAYGDANLGQVFEQRRHHLRHPLLLVVRHLLQLLELRVQRCEDGLDEEGESV